MVAPSHLKSFQALDLATRTGSLKSAAEILSITPAAVGQRIKALEDYLGVELLTRGRAGIQPTAALAAALEHLSAGFRELDVAADMLDLQRGHEIHIAAVSDFAELWLKPRLETFRRLHPNIKFCINGEGEARPRFGPVDCEVSFAAYREGNNLFLFRDFVLPISSPENTARIAKLPRRERLEGFPLLHLDFYKDDPAAPDWADWAAAHRLRRTAPNRGIRFQRIVPVLGAVLANAGLTICGLSLISAYIDDGRISLPFRASQGVWTDHAFQARFRADALSRPQVRRFREWLVKQAEATQVWLQGQTEL
jgi:LysR family glycine cleavage system transcriptional activator